MERLIDGEIAKVQSFLLCIIFYPDVALPHARPEDGVNQLGMSLLKIQKSVDLLEDPKHEIHLFICLAASDNETHLRALSSLTKILSKKESLHRLVAAETVPEILSIIQEGEK
ncbi:PTS sugar transporter subunit IIA [Enterococcus faecalis]|uniref:PTS sugar transporter subunit IIA n=1 Tax=Enterococcus faecalis TaxID=1351 RepID=UPI00046C815E|nr:PTS sugar transporter subunit IIA [Enterococcus faecalis]